MELHFNGNPIIPIICYMLYTIQRFSPKLERLFLRENSPAYWTLQPAELEFILVQFATGMSRLNCCRIEFDVISREVERRLNQLFTEIFASNRPSLWFRVGDIASDEDPTLPLIHYLEMIESEFCFPLPEF